MTHLPLRGALGPLTMPRVIPASPLLTGLVSYWKLDEASGTRVDSHGTNNLTATNNPLSGVGKIGNAAAFVRASNQSLRKTSFQNFHAGAWTWAGWMLTDAIVGAQQYEYIMDIATFFQVFINGTNSRFQLSSWNGSSFNTVTANAFGAPALSTFYFVCVRHDLATTKLKISVNLTENTLTYGTGPASSNSTLSIGGDTGIYVGGRIDEVGFWTRHLTDTEVSQLYNGGTGVTYPTFS